MIYRALRDIDTGKRLIKAGWIFPSRYLTERNAAILLQKDKIAEASLPPLKALPRWKSQSAKLAKAGIVTAGDFIEASDADLARMLKITEAEAHGHKAEFYAMFNTPAPKR